MAQLCVLCVDAYLSVCLMCCMCYILYYTGDCYEGSNNTGISSAVVAVITFTLTFVVSVTATAIITFIVTYHCVKRTLTKANNVINVHNPSESSPQEKVLYEQVCIPSKTVTKNDLELQPNPAYDTSCKVVIDTNPAYESCKYSIAMLAIH